jgi:plasmid maintenance system antidote protein VapI
MNEKRQRNMRAFGYHKSTISLFLSGKRPVSWPFAAKLAEIFPAKTMQQWKNATAEDLRRAFKQLEE